MTYTWKKKHVIMFPASKVRIMKPQRNIPTWLHSCETISHTKADICKFNRNCQQNYFYHHEITQLVSCWLLTAEVHVQSHDSLCGIYGGQDSIGRRTSPSTSVSPYQLHSTNPLPSIISGYKRHTWGHSLAPLLSSQNFNGVRIVGSLVI